MSSWASYLNRAKLYAQTRSIVNPTKRAVEFFVRSVYPGAIAVNPEEILPGTANAMPIIIRIPAEMLTQPPAPETPPAPAPITPPDPTSGNPAPATPPAPAPVATEDVEPEEARQLRAVIGQTCQWSNWQSKKSLYVRYGAMTGGVLLQTVDEPERGKVMIEVVWSGDVRDVDLDTAGNVKGYAIEREQRDETGGKFIYRKEITKGVVRYFKDGKRWDRPGIPGVQQLPYPFVPASWARHINLGTAFGGNATYGTIRKIHEANSLASHLADQIHKVISAPIMISGGAGVRLSGTSYTQQAQGGRAVQMSTPEVRTPEQIRDRVPVIVAPKEAQIQSLAGTLDIEDTTKFLILLIDQINNDLEVVTAWDRLREMTTVTGPAALALMGDIVAALQEVQAEYDTQLVKQLQMTIAIGGYRANAGHWGPTSQLTRQQKAFLPYGFDSWADGLLDFDIAPRPLRPLTPEEDVRRQRDQINLEADKQAASAASAFADAERAGFGGE